MEETLFSKRKKDELADINAKAKRGVSRQNIKESLLNSLSFMVPNNQSYRRDQSSGNATPNIKAALASPSPGLTIHEGNMVSGMPWGSRKALFQAAGE